MRQVTDWISYLLFRLGETLVLALPPEAALRLADVLGGAWYLLDARRRQRARENLRVAFGDALGPAARRGMIRQVFRSMARVPIESLFVGRLLGSKERFSRRVRFVGDVEALWTALDSGQPGVLVTGHLGNWEIAAHALRLYPVPFAAVARPIDNRHVERHVTASRGGRAIVIGRRGALPAVVRALRAGKWVGFVADQNAGNIGTYVPFFGLAASTHGAPAWVASRERVPFFVGACVRRPGTCMRFDIHIKRLGPTDTPEEHTDTIRARVAASMQTLESWVRRDPGQYNWLHRRFKDRPAGEAGADLPQYDHHRPQASDPVR